MSGAQGSSTGQPSLGTPACGTYTPSGSYTHLMSRLPAHGTSGVVIHTASRAPTSSHGWNSLFLVFLVQPYFHFTFFFQIPESNASIFLQPHTFGGGIRWIASQTFVQMPI